MGLLEDARNIQRKDPAARSVLEVILLYPGNCTAVGVPAEVVRINNKAINPADDLDQQDLPDIMAQRLIDLDRRIGQLEKAAQGDIPPTAQQVAARQRKH